jgi:Holliday junction resolvase
LAFLINEDTPKPQLLKYLEYNSTIWGGFYNALIPTDGKTLWPDWWQMLVAHSPDRVIVCGDVAEDLLQEINRRVQPYRFRLWNDDAVGGEKVGRDVFGSVPLAYQLIHIYETSLPISKSNFRIVRSAEGSAFTECAAAQFGVAREPYEGIYLKALQAQVVDLADVDLSDYLRHLSELEHRLTPIVTTSRGLSPVDEMSGVGFTIVLAGENPLADLCLFWNLRMRPSLGRLWTVVLPASSLRTERSVRALAEWCNEAVIGTNYIVLASATISKQRLLGLKKRFKPHLKSGVEHVDVWFDGFNMSPIRVFETESREELVFEDRQFKLKTPEPSFADQIRNGEWVVDISLGEGGRHMSSNFLPPDHPGLGALLSRDYGTSARMAVGHISYLVREGQAFITGTVPSDDEVFGSLFESKGYSVAQTDKCRYARGVTGLLGGLGELKIWRSRGVRDLFYEMRDGTSSYTPKEMMMWLKPGSELGKAYSMVTGLALKKVFLRGYKLQCPTCDLTRWYAVTDLAETMPCAGCLTAFQPPVEAAFRYRLNDLVARGLDQGTMSLMLTVLFLKSLAGESFMYVPGLEVFKTRKSDVDIVASCDGHLILAECKDLRAGASRQTVKDVIAQFEALIDIARDVGAGVALLSILQPSVPDELRLRVATLSRKWDKSIAVHLLTGGELEQGYRMKPAGTFLSPDDPSKEVKSTLYDFLPDTPRRVYGWVKEEGAKSISF